MRKFEKNILAVYRSANEEEIAHGMNWYVQAHDFARNLSERYDVSLPVAAGVIAALSPNSYWERNQSDAERLIAAYKRDARQAWRTKVSTYGQNKSKALRILRTGNAEKEFATKTADKTRNFYQNILNPQHDGNVTVDRFAYGIALGRRFRTVDKFSLTAKRYRDAAQAYRAVAAELGLMAHQVQAITWLRVHRAD